MTTSQFFASSYTVARAKFLAASRNSEARDALHSSGTSRSRKARACHGRSATWRDRSWHSRHRRILWFGLPSYLVDQLYQALPTKSGVILVMR